MTIVIYESKFYFWALKANFRVFDLKNIFFLQLYKIPDRWIYHMTILILSPKFCFWSSVFALQSPSHQVYFCILDPDQSGISIEMCVIQESNLILKFLITFDGF
jgi:hypothetical protein